MLVYGDHSRRVDPRALLDGIQARWGELCGAPAGIERHADLVSVFITAGELLQGLADASFARLGCDDVDEASDLAASLCRAIAGAVAASWDSEFAAATPPELPQIDALRGLDLPSEVEVKLAEGYAFYALYPEFYLEAARTLPPGSDLQAVGIRSIGAGLSAVVAAAVGGPDPVTVRPVGHPFDRQLQLGPGLEARLASAAYLAVVDEGPGLSGSSFGAVQSALETLGVTPGRVTLFPSHASEPGTVAGPERRAAYLAADRRLATFEDVLLGGPAQRLAAWVEDLTGPATAPLEDISGGGWRAQLLPDSGDWPAAWAQQERRKFLLTSARGVFLLRFIGLGDDGERRFRLAEALGRAGWSNPPLGLRHGFTVEPWLAGARPMTAAGADRADNLDRLPAYLAWRVGQEQGREWVDGASAEQLFQMIQANVGQALGTSVAERLQGWRELLPDEPMSRHCVDGRLHPWEWLRTGDGRILKSDAVDHHLAHDLVGLQDISWDLAGAATEFALTGAELDGHTREVERLSGTQVSRPLLRFMMLAYPAFQLGRCVMGAQTSDAQDAARLAQAMERYRRVIERRLGR